MVKSRADPRPLRPPTGCQCLKRRSGDITASDAHNGGCVRAPRHRWPRGTADARHWEGPYGGSCCLAAVCHYMISDTVCVHVV